MQQILIKSTTGFTDRPTNLCLNVK